MRWITLWFFPLILYSCSTASMHSETKKKAANPYTSLLTVYIEEPLVFQKFDSVFYANSIRDRFNDLRTMPTRSQMEKTLKRNLSYRSTRIISSSDVFGVNENFDYSIFRQKLDSIGAEAILLINEDQYWETYQYSKTGSAWQKEPQPNSAFHCYLVDAGTGEILWLGRCTVRGMVAGYENLNNQFARQVARLLKNKGYIL